MRLSCIRVLLTLRNVRALFTFSLHLGSISFGFVVGCGYIALHFLIEHKEMKPILQTTYRSFLLIHEGELVDKRLTALSATNIYVLVALVRYLLPFVFDHRLVLVSKIVFDMVTDDL